jgi:3-methyladenine DNA glycosylase AlkD
MRCEYKEDKVLKMDIDKEKWKMQIVSNYQIFGKIPEELRNDKEFVLGIIEQMPNGVIYQLSKISEELKDDKEVGLKLVEKDPDLISYLSRRLMNDKEIALTCLKHKQGTLHHLPYVLVDELVENQVIKKEAKNNHDSLKENEENKASAIKYLEVFVLEEKLQNDLPTNNVKVKKPKV